MCHRLFIASDADLPLVANTGDAPVFDIEAVPADIAALLPIPPGWAVTEAGSISGCACDFHQANGGCRRHLASYLGALVGRQRVLLLSTWQGDERDPWRHQPALSITGLLMDGDPIPQQTITPII